MPIPTVPNLKATRRRLDRRGLSIAEAMRRLRGGALLRRVHDRTGTRWLVGDAVISDQLAGDLISHPQIVAAGDALPLGLPAVFSQTFLFQL